MEHLILIHTRDEKQPYTNTDEEPTTHAHVFYMPLGLLFQLLPLSLAAHRLFAILGRRAEKIGGRAQGGLKQCGGTRRVTVNSAHKHRLKSVPRDYSK